MDEIMIGKLATRIFSTICPVCIDRKPDGSCDRLAEGSCVLLKKLPAVAEAVLQVSSSQMEPYTRAVRTGVCRFCEQVYPDGECNRRQTDNCTLQCFLPFAVEIVEDYGARTH